MAKHKSEDYKISAVQYYLTKNKNQLQTCEIFKCHPRSLMRWVDKYSQNNFIIMDNTSSHRNQKIKDLVNKYN